MSYKKSSRFLFPHIGYNTSAHKTALIQTPTVQGMSKVLSIQIFSIETQKVISTVTATLQGEVEGWSQGSFYTFDFSDLT